MNIDVNRAAKAYAKEEIIVDASVEKVFGILSDISSWPTWQSSVENTSIEGDAREGKGFRWKANGVTIKSILHTVSPHSELGWIGKMFWINAVHNFTIEKKEQQSLIIVEESLNGFLSGLLKSSLKSGMRQNLEELKSVSEE